MEDTIYCRKNVELDEVPEETSMDQVVYHFREIMKQKKELAGQKRIAGLLCSVSILLFILSVAISVATMNSYERMRQMESALQSISEGMERVLAEPADRSEEMEETSNPLAATEEPEEEEIEVQEETVHILEEPQVKTYIVQKGDTLAKISKMFYQTSDMVDEICEQNHIDNKDIILCGQELKLP